MFRSSFGEVAELCVQAARPLILSERFDISRDVRGFVATEFHVRHFRMRIEQEERNLGGINVGPLCNGRKGRCLGGCILLVAGHEMTTRAPALGQGLALVRIGRGGWRRRKRSDEDNAIAKSPFKHCKATFLTNLLKRLS